MSYRTTKKVQALSKLTKTERWYTQQEVHDAWVHALTGSYGDAIIYSLYDLADKPYIKLDDINPNAAVFREGKRDLVDQVMRMVNSKLTKDN
jgi:hypothetical protein